MKPFITENQIALWRRSLSRLGATILGVVFVIVQSMIAQATDVPDQNQPAAGSWTKLTNQPPFQTDSANLLTDGTVIVHEYFSPNWWRLTPDINGSYLNGTWSPAGSMMSNYKPLYFANSVLPDGRLIIEGGEYNGSGTPTWTNQGAIYDPLTNVWTQVNPPATWNNIGDSPGIVQADGIFMMGQGGISSTKQVIFNASNLTWTAISDTGKSDTFSEEGFGLLPNGKILTIDTANIPNSEIYDPATKKWTSAGDTGVILPDAGSLEIGPLILRPDGNMVAFGGKPATSLYNYTTGTWTPGPIIPENNDSADGPASLLPDGSILIPTSPGVFRGTITFYLFDGTAFTEAPATQSSGSLQSWQTRMLLLPTGEAMYLVADGRTKDVELFATTGRPLNAWRPRIRTVAGTISRGTTYRITGTQFNGLSAGSDYGDDALAATNYPLVRITNIATHHVFYARTHDHSTMGVATGRTPVSTMFDVPANAETGASMIEVVANGIASKPKAVTVQ